MTATTQAQEFDLRAYNCDRVETCRIDDLPAPAGEYFLEPKFDGFRLITHVIGDGTVESWTRSMKLQTGKVPYVDRELASIARGGTVFDGEIVALQRFSDPDTGELIVINDFEHVQSIMLSKPERAVRRALETRPLDYIVFDIMYHEGNDVRGKSFIDRRGLLETIFDGWNLQRVEISPQYPADQRIHDRMCEVGFEGTIAKHARSAYKSGDRGARKSEHGVGWYKLKTQDYVDAVCVGVKPGTPGSSWEHLAGALYFGQPIGLMPPHMSVDPTNVVRVNDVNYVVRGSCSGITFTERERITKLWQEDRDRLFGRVMQFGHMGKYPDGVRFRHPQFKGWRDDKPASEVIWSD